MTERIGLRMENFVCLQSPARNVRMRAGRMMPGCDRRSLPVGETTAGLTNTKTRRGPAEDSRPGHQDFPRGVRAGSRAWGGAPSARRRRRLSFTRTSAKRFGAFKDPSLREGRSGKEAAVESADKEGSQLGKHGRNRAMVRDESAAAAPGGAAAMRGVTRRLARRVAKADPCSPRRALCRRSSRSAGRRSWTRRCGR